jgi:hypothetical protein
LPSSPFFESKILKASFKRLTDLISAGVAFKYGNADQLMRIWLLLFMTAIGLLTPILRPALRSITIRKPSINTWTLSDFYQPFNNSIYNNPKPATTMASIDNPIPQSSPLPEAPVAKAEPELPKLSSGDFRIYNRLAVMMDSYVNFLYLRTLALHFAN